MIDSELFVQCKQWQKNMNAGLDAIIDRACKIDQDEPTHTMCNALSILAKEFGTTIPITPDTMEKYKTQGGKLFNLQVDIDMEKYEIRINRIEREEKV